MKRQGVFFLFFFLFASLLIGVLTYEFSSFFTTQLHYQTQENMEEKTLLSQKILETHTTNLSHQLLSNVLEAENYYRNLPPPNPAFPTPSPPPSSLSSDFLKKKNPFLLFTLLEKQETQKESPWQPRWIVSSEKKSKEEFSSWLSTELSQIPLESLSLSDKKETLFFKIKNPHSYPLIAIFVNLRSQYKAMPKTNQETNQEINQDTNQDTSSKSQKEPQDPNLTHIAMGVLPLSHFSFLNQIYKSRKGKLFVITSRGSALFYPEQSYLGSSLKNHPLTQKIFKEEKNNFLGEMKYQNGQKHFVSYAKIHPSNLFVAMENPSLSFLQSLVPFFIQKLSVKSFAFLFLFFILIWYFQKPYRQSFSYLNESLSHLIQNKPLKHPPFDPSKNFLTILQSLQKLQIKITTPQNHSTSKKPHQTENEKKWLLKMKNLIHELKDSLLSLHAEIQLTQSQLDNKNLNLQDAKAHLQYVENQIQSLRSKIKENDNQEDTPQPPSPLQQAIQQSSSSDTAATLQKNQSPSEKDSLWTFESQIQKKIDFTPSSKSESPSKLKEKSSSDKKLSLKEKIKKQKKLIEEIKELDEFQFSHLSDQNPQPNPKSSLS